MASFKGAKKIPLPLRAGLTASLILLFLFFTLLALLNSLDAALERFAFRWYFYLPIAAGFGLQVGLFTLMRKSLKENKAPTSTLVATGGVSSGTMALCCTHYIANLIPFMAVSGISIFFTKYEVPFLIMGIFSNVIGISFILFYIQKYNVLIKNRLMGQVMRLNMLKVRRTVVSLSAFIILAFFLYYSMIF
ncbi:hypothetical protein [Flexistipes sp.]|uniref:hypothetical protein n=1 Tax=Flexistipes sp. TaxID=3088135 RepID=UPI002E1E9502|nr:hypothetical protein [Flexistipes sp.]